MLPNDEMRGRFAFTAGLIAVLLLFPFWTCCAQKINTNANAKVLSNITNPGASPVSNFNTNTLEGKIAALQAEMKDAVQKVEKIINQPVARLPRRQGMRVGEFKPGWFHEGAAKPDFNNVDVRTSRETPYDQYDYVTSDLNPGIVFVAKQLEFNSNTKYFYKDRSLPKKKLSESEMVEVNSLYRIIGRCETEIAKLTEPQPSSTTAASSGDESSGSTGTNQKRPRLLNPYLGGGLLALALLLLFFLARRRSG